MRMKDEGWITAEAQRKNSSLRFCVSAVIYLTTGNAPAISGGIRVGLPVA
jgi:hypothetical protein